LFEIHFYLFSSKSPHTYFRKQQDISNKQINIFNLLLLTLLPYILECELVRLQLMFYCLWFSVCHRLYIEGLISKNHFIKTYMKNLIMLRLLFYSV